MPKEILKSLHAELYNRAASPLMGSFIVSWCLWNYKFVLLILSGVSIKEKYALIEEKFSPAYLFSERFSEIWWQDYSQLIFFPLITTLIYLFIYPYPARWVFAFSREQQKIISNIKKKKADETLLSVEESQEINRKIPELKREHGNELAAKDNEIKGLKEEITTLTNKLNKQNSNPKAPPLNRHRTKLTIT